MGKASRNKKKKQQETSKVIVRVQKPKPMDPNLIAAYNRGKAYQEKEDVGKLVQCLDTLEEIPGVGKSLADRINKHFLRYFDN